MEGYLYQQPLSSPPPSWAVGGVPNFTLDYQHQPRERKRDGKRGSAVKLSTDPQSVAARARRHRISDRFRILKSLVPGGSKMDTVSMLEEAIHYVKFLKSQIWLHQAAMMVPSGDSPGLSFPSSTNTDSAFCAGSYAASSASSSSTLVPPQQMFGYSMAAPPSPLPPFPSCSFPGDEEMFPGDEEMFPGDEEIIPHVSFNY